MAVHKHHTRKAAEEHVARLRKKGLQAHYVHGTATWHEASRHDGYTVYSYRK